jgi:hypothetical protein
MQFMSYDSDSGSDSIGTPAVIVKEPPVLNAVSATEVEVPLEWLQAADSSSDEEGESPIDVNASTSNNTAAHAKKFEDASLLLSGLTEKPKFLRRSMDDDKFVVAETRRHNYDEADKEHKESRMNAKPKSSSAAQVRAPKPVMPASATALKANATSASSASKNKATEDKESAKVGQL